MKAHSASLRDGYAPQPTTWSIDASWRDSSVVPDWFEPASLLLCVFFSVVVTGKSYRRCEVSLNSMRDDRHAVLPAFLFLAFGQLIVPGNLNSLSMFWVPRGAPSASSRALLALSIAPTSFAGGANRHKHWMPLPELTIALTAGEKARRMTRNLALNSSALSPSSGSASTCRNSAASMSLLLGLLATGPRTGLIM